MPLRRAAEVMRVGVPTVGPEDRLDRVREIMEAFSVREVPVVMDAKVVAIVTRTDLEPYVGQLEWTPVRVAMTVNPRTVTPDTPVHRVAKALLDGCFNGVPVVVGEVLAGMINRHDLLQVLVQCCGDGS